MENKTRKSKVLEIIEELREDKWLDDVVIVVCGRKSLSLGQLFDEEVGKTADLIFLDVPQPWMSQVFNPCSGEYEHFDRYLSDWITRNVFGSSKYLFVDGGCDTKFHSKLKVLLKNKKDSYRIIKILKENE